MRKLLLIAGLLAASAANGVEWVRVADLPTGGGHCMLADPAHERILIGGIGYRIYYPLTDEWVIREEGGLSVYSLMTHPVDPLVLFTGGDTTIWYGWIMDNYGLVTTGPYVLNGTFGCVTGLARLQGQAPFCFATAMLSDSYGGIHRSVDAGQSWASVHTFTSGASGMAVAAAANGDMLVGYGSPGYPYLHNGILRSSDGGDSWVEIAGDMPCPAYIGRIEVDPLDAAHIFAAQGGIWEPWDSALGVYETVDGGQHWAQRLSANVLELCMHPHDADILFALTTDPATLLSLDGGESWIDIRGNLPGFPRECAISPTDDRLYVTTYDDGLWATAANPTAVEAAPAAALALTAHPNPFNPRTALVFSLGEPGPANLDILDAQGRQVRHLLAGVPLPAGQQRLTWDGCDDAGRALPSGLYLARLAAQGEQLTSKLLLVK